MVHGGGTLHGRKKTMILNITCCNILSRHAWNYMTPLRWLVIMLPAKSRSATKLQVKNITKVMKVEPSLSYLISFVTAISEKEHLFHKISEQCLHHPSEVSTQTDSMVTMVSSMDQITRHSGSDRGTQTESDSVLRKVSTMDQAAQISVSEKYIQTDPVVTEYSVKDQTGQTSVCEKYTQTDLVVTKYSVLDQTPQICCNEKCTHILGNSKITKVAAVDQSTQISNSETGDTVVTKFSVLDQTPKCTLIEATSKITKVVTVDQSTQISSSETGTQVQSADTTQQYSEDSCTGGHIFIESHPKTIAENLSPLSKPLTQTLLPDEKTRCIAQESQPPTEQACLQYLGNDKVMDESLESCGGQESRLSLEQDFPLLVLEQTSLQPAVNDMFVDKTPESTFHSELLQSTKKFLKAAVSFTMLRRICTLAVYLFFIFVIGSSFLNLFVDCCIYSNTFYGTLCSVTEDLFRPYVELRHFSPPPT